MIVYTSTTSNVKISVRSLFVEKESNILTKQFIFIYFIKIENKLNEDIQLLQREWKIVDSNRKVKTVKGNGVIGQQPIISPNESFSYNSFSVIETFEGTMEGNYLFQKNNGELFRVKIPKFFLKANTN